MDIGFYGAARKVTGSKHIITLDNHQRILLDCGLFQGEGHETHQLNERLHFNPRSINYMVLSHAHTDHCGLIPRLVREGFRGPIFCTHATKDLVQAMLMDSAQIQEEENEHLHHQHGHGHHGPHDHHYNHGHHHDHHHPHHHHSDAVLYTVEDAKRCFSHFHSIDYNKPFEIIQGVRLTLTDAGHIIGSAVASFEIETREGVKRISFTGDIGRYNVRILRDPQPFPQADVLIMESTYGDKLHQSRDQAEAILLRTIMETCGVKKGRLIIPAFSLGRTQDFIYMLNKLDFEGKLPPFPVFVDSPLGEELTQIVRHHEECYDNDTLSFMKKDPQPFNYPSLHFIKNVRDSRNLNHHHGPCIIISSSGMLEGGRVRHHIAHAIQHSRNTILLNSYMAPDSLGDRLKHGDRRVQIWDKTFEVAADIVTLEGLSGHADRDEMLRFLGCQDKEKLETIYLVHGEYEVQLAFKEHLLQQGYRHVVIPAPGEHYPV